MPIVTYDQDNAYLYNEDGEPVGKIFREGDGLGPLIEERVNRWLELSSEIGNLREQVKILREALDHVNPVRATGGKDPQEARFASTQFGRADVLKGRAWKSVQELVAA